MTRDDRAPRRRSEVATQATRRAELAESHVNRIQSAVAEVERAREELAGAIAAARREVERAREELAEAIAAARRDRVTWARIGDAYGVSRQAAQLRWAHLEKKFEEAEEPGAGVVDRA
jgi:hypothetical protein